MGQSHSLSDGQRGEVKKMVSTEVYTIQKDLTNTNRNELNGSQERLRKVIESSEVRIMAKIDSFSLRLDDQMTGITRNMNTMQTKVDSNLNSVTKRVDNMSIELNQRLDDENQWIQRLDNKSENTVHYVKMLEDQCDTLKSSVETANDKLQKLEEELREMKEDMKKGMLYQLGRICDRVKSDMNKMIIFILYIFMFLPMAFLQNRIKEEKPDEMTIQIQQIVETYNKVSEKKTEEDGHGSTGKCVAGSNKMSTKGNPESQSVGNLYGRRFRRSLRH